jgi:hypothetical protein
MPSISPEKPPIVNKNTNASAQSIGVSKVIEPFHIVATQLKTFTPVGTAINIVAYIKYSSPATGIPVRNIWCAHTMYDKNAIEAVAYTIEE